MQCVADVSRRTVRASSLPELSALGAVFSGMLGMGLTTLDELRSLPADFVEYAPQMPDGEAEQMLAGWKHAVIQTLT